VAVTAAHGIDALRWWFARDVPRSGDADFRAERLEARANELADDLGNLVNRTVALVGRYRPDGVAATRRPTEGTKLESALAELGPAIDEALERFDLRSATDALWHAVSEANRFVSHARPWELARSDDAGGELDAVLALLLRACRTIADELEPFLPGGAARIRRVLDECDPALGRSLFAKPLRAG
jgi:methionyl-tRNA synthetase